MTLIRSLSYVRLAIVPLALLKLLIDRDDFPTTAYENAAWTLLVLHLVVALVLLVLAYRWRARLRYLAALNVITDFALTSALMVSTSKAGMRRPDTVLPPRSARYDR